VVPLKTESAIAIGEVAGPMHADNRGRPEAACTLVEARCVARCVQAGPSLQFWRVHDRLRDRPQRCSPSCRGGS
jgi:hypothetical protein